MTEQPPHGRCEGGCLPPPGAGELPRDRGLTVSPRRLLRVRHDTRYDYAAPVESAQHVVHLRPRETDRQRVHGWALHIDPSPQAAAAADASSVRATMDVWGNWRHAFGHARVHDRLVVSSQFVAELQPAPMIDAQRSPPWEEVAKMLRYRAGEAMPDAAEFAIGTALAPRHGALRGFAAQVIPHGQPTLAAASALMAHIHRRIRYEPLSTDVRTAAPAALAQARGVCQDFAHVMIGALRSLGLAARYASGYVLTQPPPGQSRLVGADASHAWVEVWCPAHGWVAFDPTNAVQPSLDHVTIAWGRDYADVAPLHGVIRGGGAARLSVGVTVVGVGEG
jgi:transglutaminase-like putative cysteine protease